MPFGGRRRVDLKVCRRRCGFEQLAEARLPIFFDGVGQAMQGASKKERLPRVFDLVCRSAGRDQPMPQVRQ